MTWPRSKKRHVRVPREQSDWIGCALNEGDSTLRMRADARGYCSPAHVDASRRCSGLPFGGQRLTPCRAEGGRWLRTVASTQSNRSALSVEEPTRTLVIHAARQRSASTSRTTTKPGAVAETRLGAPMADVSEPPDTLASFGSGAPQRPENGRIKGHPGLVQGRPAGTRTCRLRFSRTRSRSKG